MESVLCTLNGVKYIDLSGSDTMIRTEGDLNEFLGLCYYHDTNIFLLDKKNLSNEFFNLKSGLAGAAMQKFANYGVKAAILLAQDVEPSPRFKELIYELRTSNQIRFYSRRVDAERWLTT